MLQTIGIIVPFLLYLLLSSVHLVFCYKEEDKKRTLTKPFLLLCLGISMIFFCHDYPLIPIACFLACLGDIFLIFNKKSFLFIIGASFFAASHVLNILTQIQILNWRLLPWHYVVVFLLFPLSGLIGFLFLERKPFSLFKYAFSMLHIENVLFSLIVLNQSSVASGMMIFFGYLCCILSDIILERTTFHQDIPKRDFPIMLLYLVGQLFTYFGLAFGVLRFF